MSFQTIIISHSNFLGPFISYEVIKSVVIMTLRTVFTKLHFLHNLITNGLKKLEYFNLHAFPDNHNLTLKLNGHIHKL
jgi:hypothetical protein